MRIKPERVKRVLIGLGMVLATGGLLAGIVVCHLCGREARPAATVCGHCGAELKRAADPADERIEAEAAEALQGGESDGRDHSFLESGKLEHLGLGLVQEEFQWVRQALERDRDELAREFLLHALALETLARPDETGRRRFLLESYLERTDTSNRAARHVCPVCQGTGRMRIKFRTMSGGVQYRDMQGKLCPMCGVRGYVVRPVALNAWRQRAEEAQKIHAETQERRGRIQVGRAWLPPELAARLSLEQQAALHRALARPCSDCGGLGRTECADCDSAGQVNCADCQMGLMTVDIEGEISRRRVVRTQTCATCEGAGALACPSCANAGRIPCAACAGTGERDVCRHCEGRGIADCRDCRGAGTRRGERCAPCAGAGEALCHRCEGDGKE